MASVVKRGEIWMVDLLNEEKKEVLCVVLDQLLLFLMTLQT